MISAARQRALDVLHRRYPMETEIFALYMWPMSPSWRTHLPSGRIARPIVEWRVLPGEIPITTSQMAKSNFVLIPTNATTLFL